MLYFLFLFMFQIGTEGCSLLFIRTKDPFHVVIMELAPLHRSVSVLGLEVPEQKKPNLILVPKKLSSKVP
jgi:hypothetical protein